MSNSQTAFGNKLSAVDGLDKKRRQSRSDMSPANQLVAATLDLRLILELASQRLAAQKDPARATGFLVDEMRVMRNTLAPVVWQQMVQMAKAHPINALLQEDPFTNWSVTKPRGYSGDAVLMDLVYGHPSIEPLIAETSNLGRSIFSFTSNAPTSAGSRERRELLAKHVDGIAAKHGDGAEVLSYSCRSSPRSREIQRTQAKPPEAVGCGRSGRHQRRNDPA